MKLPPYHQIPGQLKTHTSMRNKLKRTSRILPAKLPIAEKGASNSNIKNQAPTWFPESQAWGDGGDEGGIPGSSQHTRRTIEPRTHLPTRRRVFPSPWESNNANHIVLFKIVFFGRWQLSIRKIQPPPEYQCLRDQFHGPSLIPGNKASEATSLEARLVLERF